MKKRILITGSTDGIGKLAAEKLATAGHELYLHGRNSEKLSEVVSVLKTASGNSAIHGYVVDFSDLQAVQTIGKQIAEDLGQLDVLINNAGVFKSTNRLTDAGLDLRFTVNYLAPYLLTQQLLPCLAQSTGARIINLSSAAQSRVSLRALVGREELSMQEAYAQSKLALTIWSFELARQYPEITTIAVNPGSLLNTNMVREAYGRHWSPAEKGGNILYDLALDSTYANASGKYFDNDKGNPKGDFGDAHPDAYEKEVAQQLIDKTQAVLATI
ncbi:MAG: SDR family NAD(P)-dependent oxidoreductase [Bacteroidota bacterium]